MMIMRREKHEEEKARRLGFFWVSMCERQTGALHCRRRWLGGGVIQVWRSVYGAERERGREGKAWLCSASSACWLVAWKPESAKALTSVHRSWYQKIRVQATFSNNHCSYSSIQMLSHAIISMWEGLEEEAKAIWSNLDNRFFFFK